MAIQTTFNCDVCGSSISVDGGSLPYEWRFLSLHGLQNHCRSVDVCVCAACLTPIPKPASQKAQLDLRRIIKAIFKKLGLAGSRRESLK